MGHVESPSADHNDLRSPMFNRDRIFLGNAEPLDDVKDWCELRNAVAIRRLEHAVRKQQ
jgi:hypothetical protein